MTDGGGKVLIASMMVGDWRRVDEDLRGEGEGGMEGGRNFQREEVQEGRRACAV